MAASVQLLKEGASIPIKFSNLEAVTDVNDPVEGNTTAVAAEVLECKLDMEVEIRSIDALLKDLNRQRIRGAYVPLEITADLQQVLKKALAIPPEVKSATISTSIRLNYTDSDADNGVGKTEICLSGSFLSNVISECKWPIFAKLKLHIWMADEEDELSDEDDALNFVWFENLVSSPSITEQGDSVFKFVTPMKTLSELNDPVITVDTNYRASLTLKLRATAPASHWTNHGISLPSVSEMLFEVLCDEIESDFELIAENGTRFKSYKSILAVNSKVLSRMLKTDCEETKKKTYQRTLSEDGMKGFLDFIYCASVSIPIKNSQVAFELLEAAHKYDVATLDEAIKGVFLNQMVDWMDVDVAVMLYLFTLRVDGSDELKWKAIQTLKIKPDELMKSDHFDELLKKDSNTAKEMIRLTIKTGSAPSQVPLSKKIKPDN